MNLNSSGSFLDSWRHSYHTMLQSQNLYKAVREFQGVIDFDFLPFTLLGINWCHLHRGSFQLKAWKYSEFSFIHKFGYQCIKVLLCTLVHQQGGLKHLLWLICMYCVKLQVHSYLSPTVLKVTHLLLAELYSWPFSRSYLNMYAMYPQTRLK